MEEETQPAPSVCPCLHAVQCFHLITRRCMRSLRIYKHRCSFWRTSSVSTVGLVPKYTAPIPLTAEKIKVLKSLMEHIAPRSKGKYFEDILRQQESASSGLHDQLLDEDDPEDHLLEFD
ncbi:hypothetical protein Pmani_010220 [Petrolisthes manimaculis]|uniref:Uncharacterized protein n=1 Tax=Petrolisthes manimaculis TaxID=1843537 RepID=A0AAE1UCW7_9EUCA|nr:hypothetical protein Pmani_010220 [Petrolisthes manimaculis]